MADKFEAPIKTVLSACDDYPDTWVESNSFHEPVSSDVPTRILVGNDDTLTAFSSGERVARTLENARLVQFPDVGHGVIVLGGQCAQDIVAAFVNAPLTSVDSSCVAELRPAFVLPEGAGA